MAITVFPEEVYRAPETWARRAYRNLIYFNEVDKGGHFAAWEQPELFCSRAPRRFQVASAGRLTARLNACTKGCHMKTTRIIAVAVLIVGSGLALHAAQSQQPGVKRTDLLRHDLSVSGREVIQVRVDFAPGVAFPRTAIRAKRSPMSSKACWNIRSRASRR